MYGGQFNCKLPFSLFGPYLWKTLHVLTDRYTGTNIYIRQTWQYTPSRKLPVFINFRLFHRIMPFVQCTQRSVLLLVSILLGWLGFTFNWILNHLFGIIKSCYNTQPDTNLHCVLPTSPRCVLDHPLDAASACYTEFDKRQRSLGNSHHQSRGEVPECS